jgi:NAD(P)H-flavin reductase
MAREPEPRPAAGTEGSPYAPAPFRVTGRHPETSEIVSLTLAPSRVAEVPPFSPGQFNMLYAFGVGEAAISVSGDPARPGELVHTVRSVGKVTSALAALAPGDTVGVRGPYGRGWPIDAALGKDVVIVAGGLGLPPLRPLLYEILRRRTEFGRLEIIYGARSPPDLVFYDELQRWRARSDLRLQVTVDAAGREWYGDVGVVTQRIPDARFEAPDTVAFLCGPEIMMRLTAEALRARGLPPHAIFLSMERNMKCAIAQCGHCQYGPYFVCREGPVLDLARVGPMLTTKEL